jgi:hypothetical protein
VSSPFPPLPPLPPPGARLPLRASRKSGGWASLVLHLVLILLVVELTRGGDWWDLPEVDGSAGDQSSGGGGGRQVTMIALPEAKRAVAPPPVIPPPPPVPAPVIVPQEIPPPVPAPPVDTVQAPPASGSTTGSATGSGGGSGGGAGPGTGPGAGPGSGGGGGTPKDSTRIAARDPEPRRLILIPFEYPKTMRGLTIQVTFFVLADGRVDRVLFSEDIPDRGYAKKLEATLCGYLFRPARSPAGLSVPGHTTISITF